ncbi:MAG: hypothetical protein R3B45_06560 [Bdellovibrionota bacterium]
MNTKVDKLLYFFIMTLFIMLHKFDFIDYSFNSSPQLSSQISSESELNDSKPCGLAALSCLPVADNPSNLKVEGEEEGDNLLNEIFIAFIPARPFLSKIFYFSTFLASSNILQYRSSRAPPLHV